MAYMVQGGKESLLGQWDGLALSIINLELNGQKPGDPTIKVRDVTRMEMMMICSSEVQVSPITPVKRVPGVPDGVGTEEGQLAAVLRDLADLGHLHPVAELSQDRPVP